MHKWANVNGIWFVTCTETQKDFSPKALSFKLVGKCPYCKKDALKEMNKRKEQKETQRREREAEDELRSKSTLQGYF